MKMRKIIVAMLALVLVLSSLMTLVACTDKDNDKDKAIIYVTALFAGGLYDKESGEAKWEPFKTEVDVDAFLRGELSFEDVLATFPEKEISDTLVMILKALTYSENTLLWDLTLDNDGVGYNKNIVPANDLPKDANDSVMDISYGVFGIYKSFVTNLQAEFGKDYDVFVYNQDWRISPAVSAQRLEEYINSKGYKEVVFMSHSMGAPVVNSYLARSEENRNKVKLYTGFAPATLGSFDALAALACPDVYVNNFLEGVDLSSLPVDVNAIVKDVVGGKLGDFFRNNIGLMSLVPSWQLIDSDQYGDGESGITVDGKPIESKEELYDLYKGMRWAKYLVPRTQEEMMEAEEGDEERLYNRIVATSGQYADEDGYRLKDAAATLDKYFDSLFIDGKIASEQVNSYYFLGGGKTNTITAMNLTTVRDGNGEPVKDEYGCIRYKYELVTGYGNEKCGDGTVPYYSSIGGNTATEEFIQSLGNRIVTFEGKDHGTVGMSWDLLGSYVIDLIKALG